MYSSLSIFIVNITGTTSEDSLFRHEVELKSVRASLAATSERAFQAEQRADEGAARYMVLEHMHTATSAALQREREQSASAER